MFQYLLEYVAEILSLLLLLPLWIFLPSEDSVACIHGVLNVVEHIQSQVPVLLVDCIKLLEIGIHVDTPNNLVSFS